MFATHCSWRLRVSLGTRKMCISEGLSPESQSQSFWRPIYGLITAEAVQPASSYIHSLDNLRHSVSPCAIRRSPILMAKPIQMNRFIPNHHRLNNFVYRLQIHMLESSSSGSTVNVVASCTEVASRPSSVGGAEYTDLVNGWPF